MARARAPDMLEPFLLRAIAAAVGLAMVAAPLGCIVVWSRLAYFGETVAQASLIGVVLALALQMNVTLGVLLVTAAVAGLLILLQRQKLVPMDSLLGLTHHGALALGVIAAAHLQGPQVDLMGYLFGDVFAVTDVDLAWIYGGGAIVLAFVAWLWQPLLRMAVHDELARAEGVGTGRFRALFTLLLALAIAMAIKIVGILLAIAFLIVPVVAARPFAATPERMALLTAVVSVASVVAGMALSVWLDAPGGPAIVLVMAAAAALSLLIAGLRGET
jgi:zinc transport system permease protein